MYNREIKTKFLPFVTMLYLTVMLADQTLMYRATQIGSFSLTAGVFLMPLYYFIGDLIAEVYGFRVAKKLIWCVVGCAIIYAILITALNNLLPVPNGWPYAKDYDTVLGRLLRSSVGGMAIAVVSGSYFNAFIISKLRVLVRGRYFWLRSVGSSAIGEAVQMILGCLLLFTGVMPFHEVMTLAVNLYIWQVGLGVLILIPGSFVVALLKQFEGNLLESHVNFNPFKHYQTE